MTTVGSGKTGAFPGIDAGDSLGVLADSLPQLVWSARPDGSTDYFNQQWVTFTGQPAQASMAAGWTSFLHPDDVPVANAAWSQAVATGEAYSTRYRLRRHDDEHRWFLARGLPVRDADGAIIRWMGTCTEIDEEVRAAEQLELLSQELAHRIKNIFAVINGLVSLTARNNPEFADIANELRGRILSLGRAHDMIGLGQSIPGSNLDASNLLHMCKRVLEPFLSEGGQLTISGAAISIDDRAATPLALFINELATNSAKHGALGSATGKVSLTLAADDGVTLVWHETGGPPTAQPARRGFGYRLMQMSVERQLGGTLDFQWHDDGLTATVRLPASSMVRRDAR